MNEKSAQKRQYILEKSRTVFETRGFLSVTMKDIVEACEISRGGLYLYFSDTKEIFREVLKAARAEEDEAFEKELSKEQSPTEILAIYLKLQKKAILSKKKGMERAAYEYFFSQKDSEEQYLKSQHEDAVFVIKRLIEAGIKTGEFYCEDPKRTASNMVYVLEGLKVSALTRKMSEAAIDREIMYVMQGLVTDQ